MEELLRRIQDRSARLGVVGLGYTGLPLALEFARAGYGVVGIDTDAERVRQLNAGRSYVAVVTTEELKQVVAAGQLTAQADFHSLGELDAISICVPTPLRKTKDPDISMVLAAVDRIAHTLRRGQLVVLESTTYPGTTEEVILPRLCATGLTVGQDFFLAFSPERIDPGNHTWKIKNTPKIISGVTPQCIEVAVALYRAAVDQVVPVGSTGTAEMVKLLENTFRAVNIALVNEMVFMCRRLKVDIWEVIEAAKTKPFGFMPFYPGPGLGGHCIPVDPQYLLWKLRTLDYRARFIELAEDVNSGMPLHVVTLVVNGLNEVSKSVKGASILILGVTYKRDVGDIRESPALSVIQELVARGADVCFHDPYVSNLPPFPDLEMVQLDEATLARMDCVVIVADHSSCDYNWLVQHARLVVDTRNATRDVVRGREKIVSL